VSGLLPGAPSPMTPRSLRVDLQLTGKRAVVTGGSRGIGNAVACALAAEGAHVALVARDGAALEEASRQLSGLGCRVISVPADTTDDAAVQGMAQRTATELGGIDILVNAAAQPRRRLSSARALADLSDEDVRAELETKVLGYLRCARAIAPFMVAQGWGRIVNVAGLSARQTGSITGSIRNVAVVALTKNLADELGPAGINVNAVHPGLTVTERIPFVLAEQAESLHISETEVMARLASDVSVGRLITAAEVADVVTFLASPRSVAVNGDVLTVGGGAKRAIHY